MNGQHTEGSKVTTKGPKGTEIVLSPETFQV